MTAQMSEPKAPIDQPAMEHWQFAAAVSAVRKFAVLSVLVKASPDKVPLSSLWTAAHAALQEHFGETFNYNTEVLELDIDSLNRKLGNYGISWFSDRVALPYPERGDRLARELGGPDGGKNAI